MNIAICDKDMGYVEKLGEKIDTYMEKKSIPYTRKHYNGIQKLRADTDIVRQDVIFMTLTENIEAEMLVLKEIQKIHREVIIVLTSDYIEYALIGYKINALRYLMKNNIDQSLRECLEICIKRYEEVTKLLWLNVGVNRNRAVEIKKISYIESQKRYIHIYLDQSIESQVTAYNPIREVAELLENCGFIWCHQSFLVNIRYVQEMKKNEFVLKSGVRIPISRGRCRYVEEMFQNMQCQ